MSDARSSPDEPAPGAPSSGAPSSGAADVPERAVGDLLTEVRVGPIAHGGHCVARHDSRVIFVRHALPDELVTVRLTDVGHDRFWRGDAVEIHQASADRVPAPCSVAGPGLCGGCDFQHISPDAQRRLKAAVLTEQLDRLARISWSGVVEALPVPGGSAADGLGWRTRMRYRFDDQGRPGLRAHRSHQLIDLPPGGCRIAVPELARPPARQLGPAVEELVGVRDGAGAVAWLSDADPAPEITEQVGSRSFAVRADGFWQVHPAAAETLSAATMAGLDPQPGESALDLYCGVGLFAAGLADAGCRSVVGIESSRLAVELARTNLADAAGARFVVGRVDRLLGRPHRGIPARADLVVLDPPRAGAGRSVVRAVVARRPRRIGYVACDPAALARDLATFGELGYRLIGLRAFDLFPMTQHVEAVAILAAATNEEDDRR